MKGSVSFDKKSRRWRISVYAGGKRHFIYKDPATGSRFYAREHADKVLGAMRHEADENGGILNIDHWKPNRPLAIDSYARGWIKDKDVSKKTLQGYNTAVEKYIIPYFRNKDMRRVTAKEIRHFKDSLTLAAKGVYNIVGALKTMYKDAHRDEDIARIPPFPKLSQGLDDIVEYMTLEMQDKQLAAIPEADRPIFAIGMEFGMRTQEVRALQKDCIVDGHVTIKRKFAENDFEDTTKTGEKGVRAMAITSYAQEVFDSIPSQLSPFVFVRKDGNPYTNKNLNAIWREASKQTGIKIKLQNALRHSLGCQLLDQGETIETVRQIMGHTRVEMTLRYTRRRVAPVANDALERRRAKVVELRSGNGAEQKLTY